MPRRPAQGATPSSTSSGKRGRTASISSSTPIGEIGEFELIDRLVRRLGSLAPRPPLGPGDDAALLPAGSATLVTTDTLEEDVHFKRTWTLPGEVGEKSIEINLSDIAAMGGRPTAALVSLVLPPDLPVGAADALYGGMARAARRAGILIAGGNVARAAERRVAIHVTVCGRPSGRKPVLRSGGSPGDLLVISGYPGLAGLGRVLIEQGAPGEDLWQAGASRAARPSLEKEGRVARIAMERFLRPRARIELGIRAAAQGASALIDLSDGLAGDLRHLAKASRVGARIDRDRLPVLPGFMALAGESGADPLDLRLSGGEDYELLFSISPRRWKSFKGPRGVPLTVIGELLPAGGGLILRDASGERSFPEGGFRHFGAHDFQVRHHEGAGESRSLHEEDRHVS